MAASKSPAQIAEAIQKRRNRILTMMPILFTIWQAAFLSSKDNWEIPLRLVDQVRIGANLVFAAALLFLLAAGGGLFRGKAVRELLNDEATRDHRARACAAGFWAVAVMSLILYGLSLIEPLRAADILHLILSVAVAVPALRFAMLERRAERA